MSPLITPPFARLLVMQAGFGFAFSVFLLLPKVLATAFASTPGEIGTVMAAFGLGSLIAIPAVGRVVEALGNRGALVLANLLLAAGALGFVLVHGAGAAAVLLRGLHGVAWSLGFAAGMAMAADLAPAARLAQAVGIFGAASLAMNAVAPAVAEPLGERFGYRAVFALAGAAATLATHFAKSTTRLTSTAATRGFVQIALSLAEDVVAVALGALMFFVPWFTWIFLAGLLLLLIVERRRVGEAAAVIFFRLKHPRRALREAATAAAAAAEATMAGPASREP
jgi:MFS family permease